MNQQYIGAFAQQTTDTTEIRQVWKYLAAIAERVAHSPINKLPGPTNVIAGNWQIWINKSDEALPARGLLPEIPRSTIYLEYHGYPWGFLNLDGATVSGGRHAGMEALIQALKLESER